jgi:hypothetical protein
MRPIGMNVRFLNNYLLLTRRHFLYSFTVLLLHLSGLLSACFYTLPDIFLERLTFCATFCKTRTLCGRFCGIPCTLFCSFLASLFFHQRCQTSGSAHYSFVHRHNNYFFLAVSFDRSNCFLVGAPGLPGFLIFSPLPAAIRLRLAWMFAYSPFFAAMISISNDDVLLYRAHRSNRVNVHRMIYDGQQLLNPA